MWGGPSGVGVTRVGGWAWGRGRATVPCGGQRGGAIAAMQHPVLQHPRIADCVVTRVLMARAPVLLRVPVDVQGEYLTSQFCSSCKVHLDPVPGKPREKSCRCVCVSVCV